MIALTAPTSSSSTQFDRLQNPQRLFACGVPGGGGLEHFQVEVDFGDNRLQRLWLGNVCRNLIVHSDGLLSINPDVAADFL